MWHKTRDGELINLDLVERIYITPGEDSTAILHIRPLRAMLGTTEECEAEMRAIEEKVGTATYTFCTPVEK